MIGTMSQAVRQLHTLAMLLHKDAKQSALDAEFCVDESKRNELVEKAAELTEKAEVLKCLMWISIRDELHLWNLSIGIREGFTIVKTPDTNIPPFIQRLLGGG